MTEQEVKKITSKDEKQAVETITAMINNSDTELFQELIEKSEYLFQFIKENVCKRFEMSIRGSNYQNLFSFLKYYSPDYDRVFASAIKVFGGDAIKPKMLDLIKNGTEAEKTYAARYYEISPDLFAIRELIENAFSDNDYLADACAAALGAMNEQKSYQTALEKLSSSDDFEALKGINFFVSYIKNPPMEEIFKTLEKSGMPENFAGKIAYLTPLPVLIQNDLPHALTVIDNIITGFGEILPLAEIFNYELYDVIGMLSEIGQNEFSSQIAAIMLKAEAKFKMLSENDEYTFDEDKNTKEELQEVNKLISSFGKNYFESAKKLVLNELNENKPRILSALSVIKEQNITQSVPEIINMIYESEDETVICEALSALKQFNAIEKTDKDQILSMLSNETLKAIAESYYN